MKYYLTILAGSFFAAALLAAPSNPTNGASSTPPIKQDLTFAADIQPILAKSCVRCHGSERPRKGLRLDSREETLKAVTVGDSARSRLITKAGRIGPEGLSTHPKQGLTSEQVALLRAWIDQGAK
jgi:hypothetical protein